MDAAARGGVILIADDDPALSRLLEAVLRRLGREVHVATDGDAAMRLVDEVRPVLLVLDLNMPRRGGIDVLRAVREGPGGHDMSILVLSAQAQADVAQRAREAGATDFLPKPVDIQRLLDRVRSLLGERDPA
jgi:DNA-binding response OmpR family regulator